MLDSVLIFIAFISGYIIPFKGLNNNILNKIIMYCVCFIIFCMGYEFAVITEHNNTIIKVLNISIIYASVIFIFNIFCLYIFVKRKKLYSKYIDVNRISPQNSSVLKFIIESFKYVFILLIGYIVGKIIPLEIIEQINNFVTINLVIVIFVIGVQLKLEGINLLQVVNNKDAISISIIVVISSFIAASILSQFFSLNYKQSIMVSVGLGWYSLSGPLNGNFLGEYYGVITFLIDFSREIVAISLVPLLKNYLNIELVGYAGCSAMDFSLPVIRETHGIKIIPLSIAVGIIMTILCPILLVLANIIL